MPRIQLATVPRTRFAPPADRECPVQWTGRPFRAATVRRLPPVASGPAACARHRCPRGGGMFSAYHAISLDARLVGVL